MCRLHLHLPPSVPTLSSHVLLCLHTHTRTHTHKHTYTHTHTHTHTQRSGCRFPSGGKLPGASSVAEGWVRWRGSRCWCGWGPMWAPCVAPVCFDYGCVQMNTGARATALRGDAERDIWALSSQQITVSSALRLHLIGPVSATSSFGSEPCCCFSFSGRQSVY